MIRFAAITPHPAIIVPTIGRSNLSLARRTATTMKFIGEKFRAVKAETIVVISPHGPVQYDKFILNYSHHLKGSLSQFGDQRRFEFENDRASVDEIVEHERRAGLPVGFVREFQLDHGALVPLYYLINEKDLSYNPKLIHISTSMLPLDYHYRFGEILGAVLGRSPKVVSLVASGDLSHRVTEEAPAGYSPQGRIFDKSMIELLKKKDIGGILNIDRYLIDEASECGLRPIVALLGALSSMKWDIRTMSYEAPFGVGYFAAHIIIK